MKKELAGVLLSVVSAVALAAPTTTTVTFSNGTEGWAGVGEGQGGSWITTDKKGNASYRTQAGLSFGLIWSTRTNQAFVGNFSSARSVTIGIDALVNSITFEGRYVRRHMVLELRDYDMPYNGNAYSSVWYDLGELGGHQPRWQHMSVTIPDTTSTTMPNGWHGYGDGSFSLPPGRTFADVLAGVDEAVFTTFVPDMMYGYTNFDVEVDNISMKVYNP
jgi:hypothetical protein